MTERISGYLTERITCEKDYFLTTVVSMTAQNSKTKIPEVGVQLPQWRATPRLCVGLSHSV